MANATARSARRSGNALPDGARLGEFEIRSVIGEGGFGIVYLAWDHLLHRQVAIKEYMPSTLATRSLTTTDVSPRAERFAETFALGLRSFINEAQLLASFDHPSLLKVYRFWEANGTAYMVMPYYQGITLKRTLIERNAPPDEGWLLALVEPLLDALEVMHREHCYHRDIAPDNILLLGDGTPLLLDFGAARRVIGDSTQELTAFLKPGYAPVEQYAEMPSMKQGAWTDLYALGSVVHYTVMGHTPPESVARLVIDTMVPLQRAAAGRYSAGFLRAVDHALGVRPQDRPQNVAEMRAELGIQSRLPRLRKPGDIPSAPQPLDSVPAALDDDATRPPQTPRWTEPPTIAPVHATPQALPPQALPPQALPPQALPPQALPPQAARRSAGPWIGAAVLAASAFGLLGWWALSPPAPQAAAPERAKPTPLPVPEPAQAPAPALPEATEASAGESAPRREEGTASETPEAVPADGKRAPEVAGPPASATDVPRAPPRAQAKPPRTAPNMNSPSPRCAEIIARVSLGEPLSPAERATLQGECR
jgi:serine/threonine protein kinase